MNAPDPLLTLVDRFEAGVLEIGRRRVRIRLAVTGAAAHDVLLERDRARLVPADGEPDAIITADEAVWDAVARDLRGGMSAFRAGRLSVRRDLHLGVGFLAATSGYTEPGRMRLPLIRTRRHVISAIQAGEGEPVLAVHGLGGTKISFLPTLAGLADRFQVIAIDLPGFGDSDKPLGAPYDARFLASAVVDVLDALELDRAHLIGNSLGGRVAIEVGLRHPDRVGRLGLLAPSLAWRRNRAFAPMLRLVRPELGLLQFAPREVVQGVMQRLIPDASDGWTASGIDEFLRTFLHPAGRAAFYAAARQIYLEEPHGVDGFWTRLPDLAAESLFVWGSRDRLVPMAFARHVSDALPASRHLELDCGHVPQVERPSQTNAALTEFLAGQ